MDYPSACIQRVHFLAEFEVIFMMFWWFWTLKTLREDPVPLRVQTEAKTVTRSTAVQTVSEFES